MTSPTERLSPREEFLGAIADLEGSAVSDSNACAECKHPTCLRRRNSLILARADLLALWDARESDL